MTMSEIENAAIAVTVNQSLITVDIPEVESFTPAHDKVQVHGS
jgi:hypothetical protein